MSQAEAAIDLTADLAAVEQAVFAKFRSRSALLNLPAAISLIAAASVCVPRSLYSPLASAALWIWSVPCMLQLPSRWYTPPAWYTTT